MHVMVQIKSGRRGSTETLNRSAFGPFAIQKGIEYLRRKNLLMEFPDSLVRSKMVMGKIKIYKIIF